MPFEKSQGKRTFINKLVLWGSIKMKLLRHLPIAYDHRRHFSNPGASFISEGITCNSFLIMQYIEGVYYVV